MEELFRNMNVWVSVRTVFEIYLGRIAHIYLQRIHRGTYSVGSV